MLAKWEDLPDYIKNSKVKIYYDKLSQKRRELFFKRIYDIILSLILLVVFFPLLVILSVWIKFDSKGEILFQQERITENGKLFRIYKFRTMTKNAECEGPHVTIKGDARITRAGKILRKYRLDELPQLINVLKGDMTFVGTRPELPVYVEEYKPEWYATLLLPAGVTSKTSIKFKDEDKLIDKAVKNGVEPDRAYVEIVLPQKMPYNLSEIDKISIMHDIKIMAMTVFGVFK